MRNMSLILLASLMIFGVNIGFATSSQPQVKMANPPIMQYTKSVKDVEKLSGYVKLTDQQKKTILNLMNRYTAKIVFLKRQLMFHKLHLLSLTGANYDKEKVLKFATQYGDTMKQLVLAKMDKMEKIYQVLDKEQRQKIKLTLH